MCNFHRRVVGLLVAASVCQHGDIVDESGFDCASHKEDTSIKAKGSDAGLNAYCLCCEGKPSLLVGTPERHIDADKKAVIRLHYVEDTSRVKDR